MLKRLAILGLVLLFAGSAALGWVIAKNRDEQSSIKTKAQLQKEQQERLKADIDKLASGESDARALTDFLYDENWQAELNKYKGHQEQKELIFNGSIVCMSIGGTIFSGCLLLYTIRLVLKILSGLGKKKPPAQLTEVQVIPQLTNSAEPATSKALRKPEAAAKTGQDLSRAIGTQSQKPLKTIFDPCKNRGELASAQAAVSNQSRLNLQGSKSAACSESLNPLNNTLTDLAQQVAAIREYASNQQDRVQKLQEGYDWNIIRNFCLRVIRCIDNVENRVRERAGQNGEAAHLREIRDELLFALESSGVEQFEPEIKGDYRGQEKHIEAVKERQSCDDPDLVGKIARVIRPGYKYFVDDRHVKIVRPAMVMLFG